MTLIDALNHPEGRGLVDTIEDFLGSWNGLERYAAELAILVDELEELTGYRYDLEP